MVEDQEPEAESRYRALFDNTIDGVAYCEMIYDEQEKLIDWVYIEVNKNFENLSGLKDVLGKKITEIIPAFRTSHPELFDLHGRVAMGGESVRFETHVEELERWFLVTIFCPKKGYTVDVFQNITERKTMEAELIKRNEDLETLNKSMLDRELKMVELKKENEELRKKIGTV